METLHRDPEAPATPTRLVPVLGAALIQLLRIVAVLTFTAGIVASLWLHPHNVHGGGIGGSERLQQALAAGAVTSYSIGHEQDEGGRSLPAAREGEGGRVFWRDDRGVLWQLPATDTSQSAGAAATGPRRAKAEALRQLESAGVPRVALDRGWAHQLDRASGLAGVLAVVLLILGPQPRRATKWAWFWLMLIPASLGDLVWLFREAPWSMRMMARPAPLPHHLQMHQPSGDHRMTGGPAFVTLLVSSIAIGLVFWLFEQHYVY